MSALRIGKAEGTWVIRAGGAVLGESTDALELDEGDGSAIVYFPRDDIAMAFLEPSGETSTCSWKGEATHYSIVTKSTTLANAAWSYETPSADASELKDFLAFHTGETVTVERL